ncbi:MAG: ATP-binding protein [Gammaproteobacteria bacterium]|nr:ATP-binding protein [Gammaproteobacteria bacterium]
MALTRQLLLFSRNQAVELIPVDLNEIIDTFGRILGRILGEDVTLNLDLDGHLPTVEADPGMIEQVLMNLAVNARDAMPGGGRLEIASSAIVFDATAAHQDLEARSGRFARIDVIDTGEGIADEVLDNIFEPFVTTKDVGKGTGLGLATSHGIIQQHGGWIEVASERGNGTRFTLYLPAAESAAGVATAPEALPELRGGDETILVVEDDPAVASMVRRALERHGYRILMASDGVEALDMWEKHQTEVHLLLTDMVMPRGISGRQLADRLHAEQPELEVLFTSGYSPDILAGQTADAHFAFLQKPYAVRTLITTVRARLDTRD